MTLRWMYSCCAGLLLASSGGAFVGRLLPKPAIDGMIAGGLAFHILLIIGIVVGLTIQSKSKALVVFGIPTLMFSVGAFAF